MPKFTSCKGPTIILYTQAHNYMSISVFRGERPMSISWWVEPGNQNVMLEFGNSKDTCSFFFPWKNGIGGLRVHVAGTLEKHGPYSTESMIYTKYKAR